MHHVNRAPALSHTNVILVVEMGFSHLCKRSVLFLSRGYRAYFVYPYLDIIGLIQEHYFSQFFFFTQWQWHVVVQCDELRRETFTLYCGRASLALEHVVIQCDELRRETITLYCGRASLALEHVVIQCDELRREMFTLYCGRASLALERVQGTWNMSS